MELYRVNSPIKITTIVENQSKHGNLLSEHGLSLLIECDNKCILFDTGASDLIVKNAMSLAVNPADIDYIILSHGHYDHTGGLKYMENKKVYVHPDIFIPKYKKINSQYKYIGLPHAREYYEKENNIEFVEVQQSTKLTENVELHVDFKKQVVGDFYLRTNNNYIHNVFTDELALSINTNNGLVIVTGCAHSGIINIIEKVIEDNGTRTIYALLGGFHLVNLSQKEVKIIAEKINHYHIKKIGISHCTGDKLAKYLNESHVFNYNVGDCFIGSSNLNIKQKHYQE